MPSVSYKSGGHVVEDYNMYKDTYTTGTQVSLFIGPIWVDELVSLHLRTTSAKKPVYSYEDPYFDRVLLGNYVVNGSIGIAYTEADQLMRLIAQARSDDVKAKQDLELLVNKRKSLFSTSLYDTAVRQEYENDNNNLDIDQNAYLRRINRYVERISREVEMMSYTDDGRQTVSGKPYNFTITIVKGDISDPLGGITIYEGVEILGTGEVNANDDTAQIMMYDIIAKRKPVQVATFEKPASDFEIDLNSVLDVTKEVTTNLSRQILNPPTISVCETQSRVQNLFDTSRLGIGGMLPMNCRFYGNTSSWSEQIFSFEFLEEFTHGTDEYIGNTEHFGVLKTTTPIRYRTRGARAWKEARNDNGVLTAWVGEKPVSNRYGALVYLDREKTAEHLVAIGPVIPEELYEKRGGTILTPRYKKKEVGEGEFKPPEIILPTDMPVFDNSKHEAYRTATLWTQPLGFRSSPNLDYHARYTNKEEDIDSIEASLTDLMQPVNSIAYIDTLAAYWGVNKDKTDKSNEMLHVYSIIFSEPRYVDYLHLGKTKATREHAIDPLTVPEKHTEKFYPALDENSIIYTFVAAPTPTAWNSFVESTLSFLKDAGNTVKNTASQLWSAATPDSVYKHTSDPPAKTEDAATVKYRVDLKRRTTTKMKEDLKTQREENPTSVTAIQNITENSIFVDDPPEAEERDVDELPFKPSIVVSHKEIKMKYIESGTDLIPQLFTMDISLNDDFAVSSLYRCLHLRPVIFTAQDNLTVDETAVGVDGRVVITGDPSGEDELEVTGYKDTTFEYDDTVLNFSSATEMMAYLMYMNDNTDNSCDFELSYDWSILGEPEGYYSKDKSITINGAYYLNPEKTFNQVTVNVSPTGDTTTASVYTVDRSKLDGSGINDNRTVHIFWIATILPVKQGDVKLMATGARQEGSLKLTQDIDDRAGRRVDIYNMVRCDSLQHNVKRLLTAVGDGTTIGAIKERLSQVWGGIKGVKSNTEYIWPVKTSMNHIASFVKGYTAVVDKQKIADAVLNMPLEGTPLPGTKNIATLGELIQSQKVTDDPKQALNMANAVIRKAIKETVTQNGIALISDEPEKERMIIERSLLTPPSRIVTHGLTDAGLKQMESMTRMATSGEDETAVTLGGYREPV